MRLPIKPNEAFWSRRLWAFLFRHNLVGDPRLTVPDFTQRNLTNAELSRAVSCFLFGATFKSTKRGRHFASDNLLLENLGDPPVVLDIGASSGITSIDLMEQLDFRFQRYFVTDKNMSVRCSVIGKHYFFFDSADDWILVANKYFVGYPQHSRFVRQRYKSNELEARKALGNNSDILMVHPQLVELSKSNARVVIRSHDLFDEWTESQPTVIKVANLLNKAYFDRSDLLRARDRLWATLAPGGLLLVVDNRSAEASTLFVKEQETLRVLGRIGSGCECEPILVE